VAPEETYDEYLVRLTGHQDELFRGLGRYMFEFSRIFAWMRIMIVSRVAQHKEHPMVGELLLAEATASQMTNAFCSICIEVAELEGEDKRIMQAVRGQLMRELERRNDIAHGDWMVGWVGEAEHGSGELGTGPHLVQRIKPARKQGMRVENEYTHEEFETAGDYVQELRNVALDAGEACLQVIGAHVGPPPRLSEMFTLGGTSDKRRVVRRDGVLAGAHNWT
jgi:hypothetical protein